MKKITFLLFIINIGVLVYWFQWFNGQKIERQIIEVEKVVEKIIEKPVYIENTAATKPNPALTKETNTCNQLATQLKTIKEELKQREQALNRIKDKISEADKLYNIGAELFDESNEMEKFYMEKLVNEGQAWNLEELNKEQQVFVDSIYSAVYEQDFSSFMDIDELKCASDICRLRLRADEGEEDTFHAFFPNWHPDIRLTTGESKNGSEYVILYMTKSINKKSVSDLPN